MSQVVVNFGEIVAWGRDKTPYRTALLPKIDAARVEEPTQPPKLAFMSHGLTLPADVLMSVCAAYEKALLE